MSTVQSPLNEQLDKLDSYLLSKDSSERFIINIVVGALLATLVYFTLFDISDEYLGEAREAFDEISAKIDEESIYINAMENGGFLSLQQTSKAISQDIANLQVDLNELSSVSNEIYNYSKEWFLTFDDASKAAQRMDLLVNGTNIKMSDETSIGGMKYSSFIIFGSGNLSSILSYIDWIETYGKFISIDAIIIESKDDKLRFSVAIRNFKRGA